MSWSWFRWKNPDTTPLTPNSAWLEVTHGMTREGPHKVDINNAFLNGHLQEVVYMKQLEGYVDFSKPTHVCKLKRALYRLKQALRVWYGKLKMTLLD